MTEQIEIKKVNDARDLEKMAVGEAVTVNTDNNNTYVAFYNGDKKDSAGENYFPYHQFIIRDGPKIKTLTCRESWLTFYGGEVFTPAPKRSWPFMKEETTSGCSDKFDELNSKLKSIGQ